MRIAIYTNDLTEDNSHLMPWRMVLEIGKAACEAGHHARVLSGRRRAAENRWDYGGCPVEEIAKPYVNGATNYLQRIIRREEFDILFWPVAWCGARRQRELLRTVPVPIVWYIPGATHLLRQGVRAIRDVGVRTALPFLWQSVYPKKYLIKRILGPATGLMITASQFNRSALCRAGWPADDVFAVPPGRPTDCVPANGDEPTVFNAVQSRLGGRPFYLFLGPPTGIRGTRPLLQAFNMLAGRQPEVCLVCLFRSDAGVDVAAIREKIERMSCADRIVCTWESLGRADLEAFYEACHAVVLPFLLVPSEIPLAVIEAAGHHRPVITTGPGGTAEFAEEFGLAVPAGHSGALAEAMLRLLVDKQLHTQKCDAARRLYVAHPTWKEAAQSWLSVAKKAIERSNERAVERTF